MSTVLSKPTAFSKTTITPKVNVSQSLYAEVCNYNSKSKNTSLSTIQNFVNIKYNFFQIIET